MKGAEVSGDSAPPSVPVLVATKLHAPALRAGLVPRHELVARLLADRERRLTLVCAPAGWGKSTLLGEWRASSDEPRPFAWLSLDPADGDPVRFWGYVIAALRSVRPELGTASLGALPSAGPDLVDAVVAPLINELVSLSNPVVLVLDDYHVVRAEPIHASIAFLLRHLPTTLHLAIASRVDPPLPLGKLRAAGQVTEIRAADLRFNEAEAEQLLNGSLGLGLEAADVELIRARTEGWAAGLQLAALSARTHENPHAFVDGFAGGDRLIGDYLGEVLADLPPAQRDFLLHTSILERLCAPLCDAVTGHADAARQLDEVERANLFLVSLDARREWYRYHHLFRELLQLELMRATPGLAPELHRRAARWHKLAGDVGDAIAHTTAAGDFRDAGELITRSYRPVWGQGQFETVASWIDALPREAVLADPGLCLIRGWASLVRNVRDEVELWVRAALESSHLGPLGDGTPSVEVGASLLRSTHAYVEGDVGRAIELGRRAYALDTDDAYAGRATSRLVFAAPLYFAGELERAGALLEQALLPPEPDIAVEHLAILGMLACTCFDAGDRARAELYASKAEQLRSELRLDGGPSGAPVQVARGKLLEQVGDLVGSDAAYGRAAELARRGGARLEVAHALLLLGNLKRRQREYLAARGLVREAREVLATCPDPGVLTELLARSERALQVSSARRAVAGQPADPELSERELTILRLLASELSQREIGAELYISLNTVKGHTRSIFRKLGVSSRGEAVARARELALL